MNSNYIGLSSDEVSRLHKDLLSNYNNLVRPVKNASCALKVIFKLKLIQLADVVSDD